MVELQPGLSHVCLLTQRSPAPHGQGLPAQEDGTKGRRLKRNSVLKGKFHFREDSSYGTKSIKQNHKIASDIGAGHVSFLPLEGLISTPNRFNDVAEGGRGFDSE